MPSSSLLIALLASCNISVSSDLLHPLIQLESGYNPYAIGVVGSSVAQPRSFSEFIQSIEQLNSENKNYSVGLTQINIKNLNRLNIPVLDAIEPCNNIKLSSMIIRERYKKYGDIGSTLSCYYSGNDKTGFKRENNNTSYVERFLSDYANKQEGVIIHVDYEEFSKLKKRVEKIPITTSRDITKKNNQLKLYKTINLNQTE